MLTALTADNQELFSLIDCSIDELTQIRSEQAFVCPMCHQSVILKAGPIKIPHFAHHKKNSCWYEAEAETEEHLRLKQLFAEKCLREKLSFQVEAYLPTLKQRPDLLIGKIAIEIQCSPLPIKRLVERTETYQTHGYQVVWILGERLVPKDKLTQLTKQFLYFSESLGFYLWSANKKQERIELLCHIEESQCQQFYRRKQSWDFYEKKLLEIIQLPTANLNLLPGRRHTGQLMYDYYQKLTQQLGYRNAQLLRTQSFLYTKGCHILQLPPWFYYPGLKLLPSSEEDIHLKMLVWEALKTKEGRLVTKQELWRILEASFLEEGNFIWQPLPNIGLKKLFKIVGNSLLSWLQECYVLIKVNNKYLITSIFLREDPEKLVHWLKKVKKQHFFSHTC
ncbi:competence protein CoiA [Enterococcus faecalis]|uniref:competence protein CoiA n=1 Tax=Enterococcus faecalis TaxID=1351 RepID=UPI000CF28E6C|nr:competence protein CoiA family protein [Enterococcus faecalis]EGO2631382.1 competence protein ComA [Enterococcus faecalis]EGO2832792.1 competence protein ComA [Enterococcus faecalis]EGO7616514.1 competence protein ComA [Enterococcus faecalis]EGO7911629.1 competence protein ComA [Enterococcus faecalis]EHG5969376.1 competence protein ComA [Enterococcus faecalis]